jgi:hypothetical protein
MSIVKKLIALFLAIYQLLFGTVIFGQYNPPIIPPVIPQIVNDIGGDSTMSSTVLYAGAARNAVQGIYTNPERTAYAMKNKQAVLTHELNEVRNKTATLQTAGGKTYFADTLDTFCTLQNGTTFYSSDSAAKCRVNTIRLGQYYYECHVRDLEFGSLLKKTPFKADKAFHVYADRMYAELKIMAGEATEDLAAFGSIIKIPADTVTALQIRDANGTYNGLTGFDAATVNYAAFDMKDVGVAGFIVPMDNSTKSLNVTLEDGCYVIRQTANYTPGNGINKNDESGGYALNDVRFGFRIYTDETHNFAGIDQASVLERNPLTGITVESGNANAVYIGYEALRGSYKLVMDGTDFQTAYDNPDFRFSVPISVTCDSSDRDIYIRSQGKIGCLEAAALLDNTGTLAAMDVQVCKNFQGDGGEGFYSVKDYQYGDSIFPLSLKAGETLRFTLLNLYQNWGKFPLKQISSIEFHVSYYHLSTGTTESNCIAPYFVMKKDGWTLPDHRGRSGTMWVGQPQFNSVGRLHFMKYRNDVFGKETLSEYTGSNIISAGLTYADIEYAYVSDCGSYRYTLRHTEFPQTDENRTYYTVDVTFDRDITFKNFKRDFDFFAFDGRSVAFDKLGWLNEDNDPATADTDLAQKKANYYTLGSLNPYFGYFDVRDEDRGQIDKGFGSNFALLVKNSKIIKDGREYQANFAFRDTAKDNINYGALTLDEKCITFKAGDTITLDLVLLPWGTGREETDANVHTVREDSALKPLTVTAQTGTAEGDRLVPTVTAQNNTAVFTLTGSRNNNTVRINGFTGLACPTVELYSGGQWNTVELASVHGYDGYTVFYDNLTGYYDFSFVYTAATPDASTTYRVTQIDVRH